MPRPTVGSVTSHEGKGGVYRSLRFTAYGKRRRVPLGLVSEEESNVALRHALADVERGVWKPPATIEAPPEPTACPTFHAFADEWWTLNSGDLADATRADYGWRLQVHLLKWFGEIALDRIDFESVERYIAAKLAEDDPLSPRSINMTVTLLGAILERAVKRKLIDHNPAKDKDLRVKEREPVRSYLDNAGQIVAMLDAAGRLDRDAPSNRRHVERFAALAVLIFAGLRIGEMCALRWRDVDLAGGWLHVASKTPAGRRRVKIRGVLRDVLVTLRARHQDAAQSAFVFPTATGGEMSADNFRSRVLGKPAKVNKAGETTPGSGVVALANAQLEGDGLPPLPPKLTPHSLRRTFCSLLYALGEDPGTVMDEMGHTDPALALRVYRQAMRRGKDEKAQLRELVEGGIVANSGQRDEIEAAALTEREAA